MECRRSTPRTGADRRTAAPSVVSTSPGWPQRSFRSPPISPHRWPWRNTSPPARCSASRAGATLCPTPPLATSRRVGTAHSCRASFHASPGPALASARSAPSVHRSRSILALSPSGWPNVPDSERRARPPRAAPLLPSDSPSAGVRLPASDGPRLPAASPRHPPSTGSFRCCVATLLSWAKEMPLRLSCLGAESRYFLRISGHPPARERARVQKSPGLTAAPGYEGTGTSRRSLASTATAATAPTATAKRMPTAAAKRTAGRPAKSAATAEGRLNPPPPPEGRLSAATARRPAESATTTAAGGPAISAATAATAPRSARWPAIASTAPGPLGRSAIALAVLHNRWIDLHGPAAIASPAARRTRPSRANIHHCSAHAARSVPGSGENRKKVG